MNRQGRFDLAITEYNLVRNLEPECQTVLLKLSEALLALKRTREAQRTLLEYVEQPPEVVAREDQLRCADLLLAVGLPGIARDQLGASLDQFPDDLQVLRRAAFAHFDGGDRRGGDRLQVRLRLPRARSRSRRPLTSTARRESPPLSLAATAPGWRALRAA